MQDFLTFAQKNNVQLLDSGTCQFCGAICSKGVFECLENYDQLLEFLEIQKVREHFSRFMSIDAHALQHSEIHGRWSNHFHLTRLFLVLERNIVWDYRKSPLLSNHLKEYKLENANEMLFVPPYEQRGRITTSHFKEIQSKEECFQLVSDWGEAVYLAWSKHHPVVKKIGDSFIEKQYTKKSKIDCF